MIMRCPICGSENVRQIRRPYHYTESGLDSVYLKGIPYFTCNSCKDEVVQIPRPQQLHDVIAENLAIAPRRLRPKEIRFLRTQMGWSQQQLADRLGVDRVTVCRWESEKEEQRPEPHTDFAIRFTWVQSRIAAGSQDSSQKLSKKRMDALMRIHTVLAQILGSLGGQERRQPKRMVVDVQSMTLVA